MSKRRIYSIEYKLDVIKQSYQRDNIRELENLKESRGLPQMVRVDNGPEFISRKLDR